MQDNIQRLMALLGGFQAAHGTYESETKNEGKQKLEIKASARTVREPVTRSLWERHLAGRYHLGVIPVREDGTCSWGVIDIDKYSVSHTEVVELLRQRSLPLLVVRTKSGGAHLYMFLRRPTPAAQVISKLREVAASIGHGDAEVFPKQSQVLVEKGDLGSWLNMPYFGGDTSDRHGVKPGGMGMTVGEFIHAAEAVAVSDVTVVTVRVRKQPGDMMTEGPPCLQYLSGAGFPEGTRNSGLLALGVFAKKKYPDTWEQVVEEMNRQYMQPPLPAEEVAIVLKSLRKKEYNYRCRDQPLASHCNSALCRTRRFGVGGEDDFPSISGLSVLATDPPLWFLDIDGVRIEVSTDDLQNYRKFHKVCMERLMKCFQAMGQAAWLKVLQEVMQGAVKIDAPREVGTSGQFMELLDEYLTNRSRGRTREDLLSGRPWEDEEARRHYFRLRDLQFYLEKHGFKNYSRGQIATRIRDAGGDSDFLNIRGNGRNVWWLPSSAVTQQPVVATPEVREAPL